MYSFPFATPFPLFRIPSFISGLPASGALTSVKPPLPHRTADPDSEEFRINC